MHIGDLHKQRIPPQPNNLCKVTRGPSMTPSATRFLPIEEDSCLLRPRDRFQNGGRERFLRPILTLGTFDPFFLDLLGPRLGDKSP